MNNYNLMFFLISLLNILWFKIGKVEGIFNGKYAKQGLFKYHVSVLINNKLACGGSIIKKQYILTAGQCILDENGKFLNVKISVTTGIYLDEEDPDRMTRDVIKAYVPYEFRRDNQPRNIDPKHLEIADIAVLKLKSELSYNEFSPGIHLLLPEKNLAYKFKSYVSAAVNLTGFGLDTATSYTSASDIRNLGVRYNSKRTLMYSHVHILSKQKCLQTYPWIGEEHMCARAYHPDSEKSSGGCRGDIGGPLVLNRDTVIGILIRYVDYCDERYSAALYTRVSSFQRFINWALNDIRHINVRYAEYNRPNVIEFIPRGRMSDLIYSENKNDALQK